MKNFWLGFKDALTYCEGSRDTDPKTRDLGFTFAIIMVFITPIILVLILENTFKGN